MKQQARGQVDRPVWRRWRLSGNDGLPAERPRGKDLGVSQNEGYLNGGPHDKDYSILGSILGSPSFGKLPFGRFQKWRAPK